jgi:hypothetical protein
MIFLTDGLELWRSKKSIAFMISLTLGVTQLIVEASHPGWINNVLTHFG